VLAALLAAGLAAAAPAPQPLFGIDFGPKQGIPAPKLVRIDARTLRPLPGPTLALRDQYTMGMSLDQTRLVVGKHEQPVAHFVDLPRMRRLGSVRLAPGGSFDLGVWIGSRFLAIVDSGAALSIVAVDGDTRRVVARSWLGSSLVDVERLADRVVFLLAPRGRIGPARLAVVDADARVRAITLRVEAGRTRQRERVPGLAVDRDRLRAYVVEPDLSVAQVELDALTVSYHRALTRTLAKGVPGAARDAGWLGGETIAVTGWNGRRTSGGTHDIAYTPAGLMLIDAATWDARVLDPTVSFALWNTGTLLALARSEECPWEDGNLAVTGYAADGSRRFRLCNEHPTGAVRAADGIAYVDRSDQRVTILDLANGRVLGRAPARVSPIASFGLGGYTL
jgi:hypothetical protein